MGYRGLVETNFTNRNFESIIMAINSNISHYLQTPTGCTLVKKLYSFLKHILKKYLKTF
jgi:hypothetical protein